MMSLSQTNTGSIAIKQIAYKIKGFSFISLAMIQLAVILFSASGIGMYGTGNGSMSITVKNYSSDVVIVCTIFWIFIMSMQLTKKQSKTIDFTLVSNRLSSSLSDLGFLILLCLIGAFTASLSGMLQRLVLYFAADSTTILESAFKIPLPVLFQGMAAAFFYMLLFSGIGYLFGMLIEVHKLFAFILPSLLFAFARVQSDHLIRLIHLFTEETSVLAFSSKAVLCAVILFSFSFMLFEQMEVRESCH
jgi:hypothetical protein